MIRVLAFLLLAHNVLWAAFLVEGEVVSVDPEAKTVELEVLKSGSPKIPTGNKHSFRLGRGDLEIGYSGRRIRANAVFYNKSWHLEQIFPIDGEGAGEVALVNRILHRNTDAMKRGKFLREGDTIPNFGMIDQHGEFVRIEDLRGNPFVLNFIFTRCQAAKMCPASSTKMEELQEAAREAGLSGLHFVTVSFDPAFDSPGTLRSYGRGYGMEFDNFHLLTMNQEVVDDLLRQFGIMTIEEDGTINHTMATLLIDAEGKVAYRKEGPSWKVEDFIKAAKKL
ncbi:MAG TPA: SCO family protein [Opitutales bacterium]|nr:SCO family protein [Opitutales bacterium]